MLESAHLEESLQGRLAEDAPRLADGFAGMLRFIAEDGPSALVDEARSLQSHGAPPIATWLQPWWSGERETRDGYLARALLRPYVEALARLGVTPDRARRRGPCPLCAGGAWIAARRGESGEDGARRSLGCALCGGEWPVGRILCPSCGEGEPTRLPSFHTGTYPGVRIEACDACRRYVKSIDLTLDGRAVPEVDDLVSLSLDLWASSKGYSRLEPGLAGL